MLVDILRSTLPMAGSDVARDWDAFYAFLTWTSTIFFVGVVAAMVIFTIKYRHRAGHKADTEVHGNVPLEIVWTVIPTILVMVVFVWGYALYRDMVTAPGDSVEIKAIGKQWLWQFQYDDGRSYTNKVFVPVNRPVKFIITSEDVLHSFFVPNMRVKKDAVPGRYTTVWFEATAEGAHIVYCAEYCGTQHSGMLATVYAVSPEIWRRFIQGREIDENKLASGAADEVTMSAAATESKGGAERPISLIDQGRGLVASKGCVACHSVDGKQGIGPSLKGIHGAGVDFANGDHLEARDLNYLREAIEFPNARLVKGYGPMMPTFRGMVSETELTAMLEYIKSLK
ncbi:MAG: cytochrome c oxidase subunit II [Bdellovibrionales bacterium]|nr:cytochrome c oxidase subunit II [Bdellovibrionales bacterium]